MGRHREHGSRAAKLRHAVSIAEHGGPKKGGVPPKGLKNLNNVLHTLSGADARRVVNNINVLDPHGIIRRAK